VDETLIFLLTKGSNLRIVIDHRSINSFEGNSDRRALFTSAQPVPLGASGIVAKGTETHTALWGTSGAELKWLDPH